MNTMDMAGQVAVTTSVANPRADFEINALGTLMMSLVKGAPLGGLLWVTGAAAGWVESNSISKIRTAFGGMTGERGVAP